jgi:hypothetical protein
LALWIGVEIFFVISKPSQVISAMDGNFTPPLRTFQVRLSTGAQY